MPQVKRSGFLFLQLKDKPQVDVAAFLRGELRISLGTEIVAFSPLTARERTVSPEELQLLQRIPAGRWMLWEEVVAGSSEAEERLSDLVREGLVLTDEEEHDQARRLRHLEEQLLLRQWNPYAALFHAVNRGSEEQSRKDADKIVDLEVIAESAAESSARFVARHGKPPAPFHQLPETHQVFELPLDKETHGELFELLGRRRTTRAFQCTATLSCEDLATLLRSVFGCHGYSRVSDDFVLLKRTSPSGGSLHPIEAYPLILRVAGVPTGLYHYNASIHALELVRSLELAEAERLATQMAAGQTYVGTAQAVVVLTARFFRSFWKYRRDSRTYSVLLMDAGHLSQTFYLVAEQLGLGAFFTAALNVPRVEEALRLNLFEEGPIGICGCGLPSESTELGLTFRPFQPRTTKI